jgi:endonuclease-3
LILHGRYVCLARSPKCEICPISWFCKYYERTHTEAALRKAELLKNKKAIEQKKRAALNKISKELAKRSVNNGN